MADTEFTLPDVKPVYPGYGRKRVDGAFSLREMPWCGKINLRGEADNTRFTSAVAEILRIQLPLESNSVATFDEVTVFCLGPDEWLVHCDLSATGGYIEKLETAMADCRHAITDVSDYYTVLELDGKATPDILARGCPMDLHPEVFTARQCAQTRFGTASILLYRPGRDSVYQLQVRWSYTEYVWDYLVSALDCL